MSSLLDKDYTEYIGECDFDRTMIHLCKQLQIWPPVLVDNPITHLINELQLVTKYPVDKSDDADVDVLSATHESLSLIENNWNKHEENVEKEIFKALTNASEISDTELENYLNAYSENTLSEKAIEALAWIFIEQGIALDDQGRALSDDDTRKQAVFEQAGEKYRQATEIKRDYHQAYKNLGITLEAHARTLADDDVRKQALFDQSEEKRQQAAKIKESLVK